jgi:hypothetical protein
MLKMSMRRRRPPATANTGRWRERELAQTAGEPGWHEPRWPATVALLVCVGLYLALPARLLGIPRWVVPTIELLAIIPLSIGARHRHPDEPPWSRVTTIIAIAFINLANIASIGLLVHELLRGGKIINDGRALVYAAVLVWTTNFLVFGLWFWELDRGGPAVRQTRHERHPDFLFPQMTDPSLAPEHWEPGFLDYIYVGFTNATAFSPTDAMPLTVSAKVLMAIESAASLITVVVVAARAVNILQT